MSDSKGQTRKDSPKRRGRNDDDFGKNIDVPKSDAPNSSAPEK